MMKHMKIYEVDAAKVIRSLREDRTDAPNPKEDKTFVPPESEESTEMEEDKDESVDTLKRIQDIPSPEGVPKKRKQNPIPPSEVVAKAELMCNAFEMCLVPEKMIVLEGEARNASLCTKCRRPFHHECLLVSQEQCYCLKCFKQYRGFKNKVISRFQDSVETP